MRILIDIPKEFEQHFQADKFRDSLFRLSADAHLLAGLYEKETAWMLIEVFKNAISIPIYRKLIDPAPIMQYIVDGITRGEFEYDQSIKILAELHYAPNIISAVPPKEEV